jgi:hypothetical protein
VRTVREGEVPRRSVPFQLPIAPDESPAVPLLRLAGMQGMWVFVSAILLRAPPDQRKTGNMEQGIPSRSLPLTIAELTWADSTGENSAPPYKCPLGQSMAIPPA